MTTVFNDSSNAPGHAVHKASKIVWFKRNPDPTDPFPQLLAVRGISPRKVFCVELSFHVIPHMLYGVKVWRLGWPVHHFFDSFARRKELRA
jgi:hypothetical protein